MYQYCDNHYHLCDYRSHRSDSHRTAGRSSRIMGRECCHNQWHTDSLRTIYLYNHADRRLRDSDKQRHHHSNAKQYYHTYIGSSNDIPDSMSQYGNNEYHLCNYGSNRSNLCGTSDRSNRCMACQYCHYQWHTNSGRTIYLYNHADRRLRDSDKQRHHHSNAKQYYHTYIGSSNDIADSMYQYGNNEYHLLYDRSDRSNLCGTSDRSNRSMGGECCYNQWFAECISRQSVQLYGNADRRLRDSNKEWDHHSSAKQYYHTYIGSSNDIPDSMSQYGNNEYHLSNYRSDRSNLCGTSDRSNRCMGGECCYNQWFAECISRQSVQLYGNADRRLRDSNKQWDHHSNAKQYYHTYIGSSNDIPDSMSQYGNNEYHLCNYRSDRSNLCGTSDRSNRCMGGECCYNQWFAECISRQSVQLYGNADRRLRDSNKQWD